jgi:hypothetical protein
MTNSQLHIVTVATESKFYFPYLVESCKRNGTKLVVLGYGEKWLGFNWRLRKMMEFLKTLPDNDVVCFLDGYDILCTRKLNQLIPEFVKIKNKSNCKIIVGSDQHYTFLKHWAKLTYGECSNKLINAGNYIGYKKDLLEIIEHIYVNNPDDANDDQLLLTKYCVDNPSLFYIDTKSEIFLVYMNPFTEVQDIEIKNNTVYYNNQNPFFVHTPGGFLDKLIIDLGYKYDSTNNIKEEIYKKVFGFSIFNQLKNGIHIFVFLFIILLLMGVFIYFFTRKNQIKTKIFKKGKK